MYGSSRISILESLPRSLAVIGSGLACSIRTKNANAPLATPARPAAVAALIAASIAGHDGSAFGAERGVLHRRDWSKGQRLLRVGFGRTQRQRVAYFARRVFGAKELRAQPAENVIHDRLGVRDLRIPRETAGLETHVAEFIDQEFQRHAVMPRGKPRPEVNERTAKAPGSGLKNTAR